MNKSGFQVHFHCKQVKPYSHLDTLMTQKRLLKKLAIFCYFLMLFNTRSFAQIIYTDIPDATPNATYPLDLNNDNTVDFLIQFGLIDKVMCIPQNNNAYAGEFINGMYLPWALSASSNICDSLATWYDANNPGTMAWGTTIGYWAGASNTYLALKLMVGTNTYYGWARFDFQPSSTSFTIKDYAYESTPNACIQAGESSLGIAEEGSNGIISIGPNPFSKSTTIKITGNPKNASLTLYNAYGQLFKEIKNITEKEVSLSRDHLPSGIYFIQVTDENKSSEFLKLIVTD
jgi:hypothetical protein